MSHANVDLVRRGYESFLATGKFAADIAAPGFVWDMSKFSGWPEQQTYEGEAGSQLFLDNWLEAWENWSLTVETLHDAGEKVVAIVRQHGRSKASGLPVDMFFAQVWTVGEGALTRMEMYADPAEALAAEGLAEHES